LDIKLNDGNDMEDWIKQEAVQGVDCQEISNIKYPTPNTEVPVNPTFGV
jgi:hypothetical protein